jgi:hypothetical protein
MHEVAGQIDIDSRAINAGTLAAHGAEFTEEAEHITHWFAGLQGLAQSVTAAGGVADDGIDIERTKRSPVLIAKRFDAIKSGMFLESTAAALALRDGDLHVVLDEHTHRGEVDLAEHGFHQASGEKSHTRTGGAMSLHEFLGIRSGALQSRRTAREQKAMQAEAGTAQKSSRKQGEIEQHRVCDRCRGESERELGFEAMRGDVFMTNMLEDFTIRHRRWTGRLAGETTDTLGRVKVRPLILRQSSCCFLTPQTQTTTR